MVEINVQEKTIIPTKRPLMDASQLTVKIFFVDALSDMLHVNFFPIFSQMKKNSYIELIRMHRNEPETRRNYCETHETKFDCTWI
jgi:hypothetical protein